MFGNKLSEAQARIGSLMALLAVAGLPLEADTALPTPEAFTAQLKTAKDKAVTDALTPVNASLAAAQSEASAFKTGLAAAGVKLGEFSAADFAAPEGKTAAESVAANAIKNAVETAVTAKSARQIAAAGHPHALDIKPGEGSDQRDAKATPENAEAFLATYRAIKDPGEANAYFKKHSHRFPV